MPKNTQTKIKPAIKAVLFDLGKVILFFNFEPAFKKISKVTRLSTKEIEDYFVSSGLEVLYDGGKISSFEFYQQVKKSLGFRISYPAFGKIWNDIFTPNQKIIKLIQKLKKRYRLVLVSNTNPMHFEFIQANYPVLKLFDDLVLSYEEKIRKPDARIYRTASLACRAKPNQILYIDDRPDLTQAAQALGFHVFTYRDNHKDLLLKMKSLGITS